MKFVIPTTKAMVDDKYIAPHLKDIVKSHKLCKYSGHKEIPLQDGYMVETSSMDQYYDLVLFCACFDVNFAIKLYDNNEATLVKFENGGLYSEEVLSSHLIVEES